VFKHRQSWISIAVGVLRLFRWMSWRLE